MPHLRANDIQQKKQRGKNLVLFHCYDEDVVEEDSEFLSSAADEDDGGVVVILVFSSGT